MRHQKEHKLLVYLFAQQTDQSSINVGQLSVREPAQHGITSHRFIRESYGLLTFDLFINKPAPCAARFHHGSQKGEGRNPFP
jgi:hypothetical protein